MKAILSNLNDANLPQNTLTFKNKRHSSNGMDIWEELAAGIETVSETACESIAQRLAATLPADWTLALEGDLGTGKTTFVRGLARAWDIQQPITSPTFNLMSLYRGKRTLVHIDAYRLEGSSNSDGLYLDDFLQTPYCLVVEWPTRLAELPSERISWLQFSLLPSGHHHIQTRDHAI